MKSYCFPLLFILSSCVHNWEHDFYENTRVDWKESVFSQLKPETQYFKIQADSTDSIQGKKGIKIVFPQNSFQDNNGQIVSGEVDVELIEMMSIKDMIGERVHTVTVDNQLLVSGGSFKIKYSQNGTNLDLIQPVDLTIQSSTKAFEYESGMALFSGDSNSTPTSWVFSDTFFNAGIDTNSVSYKIRSTIPSIANCDAFYSDNFSNLPKTQFQVKGDFEEDRIFFIVEDLTSFVGITLKKNDDFSTYESSIPLNIEGTLLRINYKNDQLSFGTEQIVVSPDSTYNISVTQGTFEELEILIDSIEGI